MHVWAGKSALQVESNNLFDDDDTNMGDIDNHKIL